MPKGSLDFDSTGQGCLGWLFWVEDFVVPPQSNMLDGGESEPVPPFLEVGQGVREFIRSIA